MAAGESEGWKAEHSRGKLSEAGSSGDSDRPTLPLACVDSSVSEKTGLSQSTGAGVGDCIDVASRRTLELCRCTDATRQRWCDV